MSNEQGGHARPASSGVLPARRGLLGVFAALVGAGFAGTSPFAATGKKNGKKCTKKCPPATCADVTCGATCGFCYDRTAAAPLCGDTLNDPAICIPCATDNDCIGTNYPYCVSGKTSLVTGESDPLACPGMPAGYCGKPNVC